MPDIYEQLKVHEGFKDKPYKDTEDKWTIGIGRNLEDKPLTENEVLEVLKVQGITEEIAENWLKKEVKEIKNTLQGFKWYNNLNRVRQKVIIDMCYNLGFKGFLGFKKTIQAIKNEDFKKASIEMLDSDWAEQVKIRSKRLAKMMRIGEDYKG